MSSDFKNKIMNKLTPAQLMYISGYVPTSYEDIIEYSQGGIHIKPSHVGRFTEYKKRTGKTTEEALHSPDPHVRQMANFARNAAKWKHEFGGTPMQEFENNDYTHNIYDDKSGDLLRENQKNLLLNFLNNPNPVMNQPEFSYKQQGGTQQDQIMQLIQMYAQLAKVDPKQLMKQLQQMQPEQQQATLQKMAEQVQSVQSQGQQEMMAAGGVPTQYRLRGENVNKLNDITTNLGMLGEAGNLATTASAIDNPVAQGIAGIAGLIGGLAPAVRGWSWLADKTFGNNNMKNNEMYQDYFSKLNQKSSQIPKTVGKASAPQKGMFQPNTAMETWNNSKPSNDLWNKYGVNPRNKEWDTYMSNQQILKNLPDFSKLTFKGGGEMIKRADGSYSQRGLWDNIRANKGSGKKPTKEMLEQERKIKSKEYGGGINNPGFKALPEYVQEKIIENMQTGGPKRYKIKDEREEALRSFDNTRTVVKPKVTDVNKVNVRNKTQKELAEQKRLNDKIVAAERKALIQKGDNAILNQGLNVLNPELWTAKNWSDAATGLGEKFRFFPNDSDSFVDDYLNPFQMVGNMAESLGKATLQAEESDSYLPYVTAIGAPLAVGALAGIGAPNTKQFVNNLVNPAAGVNLKNMLGFKKGMVKGEIPKVGDEFANAVHNIDGDKVFYDNTATQDFPTGEWKYLDELSDKGGISEVAPFNEAVDEQIVKATYGKRPLVSPEQIYTEKEIAEIVKKRKQYNDALKQYDIDNPEDGLNFMEILSGENSHMDRFHNLHPNLEFPGFDDKFTTDSFLMKQNQPRSWRINPLSGDTTLKSAEGLDFSKDWYYTAKPKDYVSEHRGSLGLSLDDIKNMSEDELKKIAEKKFKQLNQYRTERFKKDIETPFTGKEAFKNLNPNKYGGLPKAQLGRNGLPFPVGVGSYADNVNDSYSRNIASNYPSGNPSEGISLTDEELANENGMYDGYAFPGGPISKINNTGKVNPNIINTSGQRLALNALTSLGAARTAANYFFKDKVNKRDMGNTMFNEAINQVGDLGNYTTNAGPASNFQLRNNIYPQSLSRYGGKTKSFKAGGQYNVSEEELLQLMRDGAEIEFL
jgi:hypothetical protein